MKKYLLISLLLIITPIISSAAENESDKILECFKQYKKCIIEQNGVDFVKFMDKKSIWYHDSIVEDSLYLPQSEFAKLSMVDKYLIMRIRSTVAMGELLKMHGKELIIYTVEHEWYDKKFTGSLSIRDIQINNDTADVNVYSNDAILKTMFRFKKENGEWKFALVSYLNMQNKYLKTSQAASGMSEVDFLISILEPNLDIKIDKYVFEPVLKK